MSDTPQPPGGSGPPAGWYQDPQEPSLERYWDGERWTSHTQPAGRPVGGDTGGYGGPGQGGYGQAGYGQGGYGQGAYGASFSWGDAWLWQSIVATLFCCLPAGVVGIVFAAQAKSAADAGNLQDARNKANIARTWTLASVGLGLATIVVALFVGLAGNGFGS